MQRLVLVADSSAVAVGAVIYVHYKTLVTSIPVVTDHVQDGTLFTISALNVVKLHQMN